LGNYYSLTTDTNSIWQVGVSAKPYFNNVVGIMTDTIQPYHANKFGYVEMDVTNYYYPYGNILKFRHKYETDSAKANGTITISTDSGKTFHNLIADSTNLGFIGACNFYYDTVGGRKADTCFEGTSGRWITTVLLWAGGQKRITSFKLRFNFKADSTINTTKAGWCIQYINYFTIVLEDVQDITSLPIKTYPNPCTDAEYIDLRKLPAGSATQLQVCDILGRTIYTLDKPQGYLTIDTHIWAQGTYIVKLVTSDGKTYTHKLTKQ